jgi:hypothetical protein
VHSSSDHEGEGVLWPTLEAINAAFTIGFAFDDIECLEKLLKDFYDHSSGILDGCVLALDGLVVSTRQSYKWGVQLPKDYHLCMGGFAIIVLAGCDI